MNIKSILKFIRSVLKVSWALSIYFNLKYLPFKQAKHLPILLYHPASIKGKGIVVLNVNKENIKMGMIKLGLKHEECVLSRIGVSICNEGTIEFNGSGLLGNGSSIVVKKDARLCMGENFGITGNLNLHCNNKINIGKFFSCSWDVSIDDSDHHRLFDAVTMKVKPVSKPIEIADYVWLCQRSIVLKGSSIPSWCTIAANSLVNTILPPPRHLFYGKRKIRKTYQEQGMEEYMQVCLLN